MASTSAMVAPPYRLSCVLYGHTLDVRAIAVTPDSRIISASRDKTAKIWTPIGSAGGYEETGTFLGHGNFVSAVCYLPPHGDHKNGLVVTGSNDSIVRVFDIDTSSLLYTLQGHGNAVCGLSAGLTPGSVLSSSWDKTTKLWPPGKCLKPQMTLTGHQAAVWAAIQLPSGLVVTGSADQSVRLWTVEGQEAGTMNGHTDCVRSLAVAMGNTFLSAANDATVRHWSATTGDCLGVYNGHSNYIYCVAWLPDGGFASCGEAGALRVWLDGIVAQEIQLPAESVWAVGALANGDICAATSDGLVRVFSRDPDRFASDELMQRLDEQVAAVNSAQALGGIDPKQLSGPDGLLTPGVRDGVTKLIREEGGTVAAYGWSQSEQRWDRIGEVTGASGGTQANSGKQLHEGQEFDYVFSVDIEEGRPPLKLPFNRGEDPWTAAQKFIHKHDLSQAYLEQVANFIVSNSTEAVVAPSPQIQGADPFTGGSRYIPGGAAVGAPGADPFTGANRYVPGGAAVGAPGADPFTGANRYVPGGGVVATPESTSELDLPTMPYFPHKSYLRFDQANINGIRDKLSELNGQRGDASFSAAELSAVVALAADNAADNADAVATLQRLLDWPDDALLPVLDVTRLAVRSLPSNKRLCSDEAGDRLANRLVGLLAPGKGVSPGNQLLALRCVVNMMQHPDGERLALDHATALADAALALDPPLPKNTQVAAATVVLNLSIAAARDGRRPERVAVTTQMLTRLADAEARFRALVALGTLVWEAESIGDQDELKQAVRGQPQVMALLERLSAANATSGQSSEAKAANCAAQVLALVQI